MFTVLAIREQTLFMQSREAEEFSDSDVPKTGPPPLESAPYLLDHVPILSFSPESTVRVNRLDWSFSSITLVIVMISQFRQKIYARGSIIYTFYFLHLMTSG